MTDARPCSDGECADGGITVVTDRRLNVLVAARCLLEPGAQRGPKQQPDGWARRGSISTFGPGPAHHGFSLSRIPRCLAPGSRKPL